MNEGKVKFCANFWYITAFKPMLTQWLPDIFSYNSINIRKLIETCLNLFDFSCTPIIARNFRERERVLANKDRKD